MNDSLKSGTLKKHFSAKKVITTFDIRSFYQRSEPGITESTLNWRIHNLVKTAILKRVSRGMFVFSDFIEFSQDLHKEDIAIYKKIHIKFPFTSVCVWNTRVFNHFTHNMLFKYYTLVEVERDAMRSVFYFLNEIKTRVVYNPTAEIMDLYAGVATNTIIVIPLISQAPLLDQNGVITPSIEKILVDIFCDPVIFASQQQDEMQNIFEGSFRNYNINLQSLLRYAGRRNKQNEITAWMKKNPKIKPYMASIFNK